MALTNIFREPRREITETIAGIAAIVIVLGGLLAIGAKSVQFISPEMYEESPIGAGIVALVVAVIVVFTTSVILNVIHDVGEEVCGSLQKRGINLRPKRRY
jgi:hypothetical protein